MKAVGNMFFPGHVRTHEATEHGATDPGMKAVGNIFFFRGHVRTHEATEHGAT